MLVKKVSSEKPASKQAVARCYLLMLAVPCGRTRGHMIMSGHLAVSVCLERCVLVLDIVLSLIMAAVCVDKVKVVGHAAAQCCSFVLYAAFLVCYVVVLGERQSVYYQCVGLLFSAEQDRLVCYFSHF